MLHEVDKRVSEETPDELVYTVCYEDDTVFLPESAKEVDPKWDKIFPPGPSIWESSG
jgi:hypothetical protein